MQILNIIGLNFSSILFSITEFWQGQGQGELLPKGLTRAGEEERREPKVSQGVRHGAAGSVVHTVQMEKGLQSLWGIRYLWQPLHQWFIQKVSRIHSSTFKDKGTVFKWSSLEKKVQNLLLQSLSN